MSLFLEKLRGSNQVDNNAPPDATGLVIRRIQKQYADEPVENLGLNLTDDAEVKSVVPGSAAAKANVQSGLVICYINDQFIESKADFLTSAKNSIYLDVKFYSAEPMSELIAKMLDSAEEINCDELLRTTPRYGFLSHDHPLFRRYSRRLDQKRQAHLLLKQTAKDMEEQQRLKRKEEMREEVLKAQRESELEKERLEKERQEKEKLEKEKREAEEKAKLSRAAPIAKPVQEEPFIKVNEVKSNFNLDEKNYQETVETTAETENTTVDPSITEELLALVGVPVPPVEAKEEVRCELLPSEEYTLSTGEKVVCTLKRRTGPIPPPPPGRPPKMSRAGRKKETQ